MKRPMPPPYGEIRVKLPRFLIIALREIVKETNARDNDPRWTVSQLLESFLFETITSEEMDRIGAKSEEFRREAEVWLRWIVQEARSPKRRYRK